MENVARPSPDTSNGYEWKPQVCPICEIPPTRRIGLRGGKSHRENSGIECEIWACGACSLLFPDPMPIPVRGLGQHYAMDAEEYFAAHEELNRSHEARELVQTAERLLDRKGKLLDVGVGRGEILLSAIDNGWICEGVEPSDSFAEYIEKQADAKIWRRPIEECDIPAGEFDVVILSAVLEHLYDPDVVIKKIANCLKPGGLLYLDVPNEMGLYFKLGNAYQRLRGRDWTVNLAPTFSPFHIFGFSPRSLRKLLQKYSLEPTLWKVYGGSSLVPSNGSLAGTLERLSSMAVTSISNIGEMGTYIQTWAVKK